MPTRLHRFAAFAFVLLLALPMLQTATGWLPAIGLGGVVKPVPAVEISLATWNDGSLQQVLEAQLTRDLGLRDWMVRTDNELRYGLFGSLKRPVLANDKGWLLDDGYLPTKSIARDMTIVEELLRRAHDLARLQKALAAHDVHLAVCISPSKTWVFPERLTGAHGNALRSMLGRYTYQEVLRAGLELEQVRTFDFGEQFRIWRYMDGAEMPPLFPRGGIHWSNHAAARATLVMADAMEDVANTDFRTLRMARTETSPVPVGGEDDLVKLANLLDTSSWQEPSEQPVLAVRDGEQGAPMPTLLVGTSFLWPVARTLAQHEAAAPLSVWYYFKSEARFVKGKQLAMTPLELAPEQLKEQILRYRVVILEGNESAMPGFGQGFVEAALRAFGEEPVAAVPPELWQRLEAKARAQR